MIQNNALSQNWVECIGCTPKEPRLGAVSWSVGRHIVVVPGRVVGRVAARTGSVVSSVARIRYRVVATSDHDTKNCIATQSLSHAMLSSLPHVSQCSYAVSQGAIVSYRSPWRAVSLHKAFPSYHDTNDCIATPR